MAVSARCSLGFHVWRTTRVKVNGKRKVVRYCPRCYTYTKSRLFGIRRRPLP